MKVSNPFLSRLLFVALAFFTIPVKAGPSKDPLFRIGFVYPRTGPLAPFGSSLSEGVKLGLAQFRAENPQLGSHVGVVVADDGSLASEAEKSSERLIKMQNVHLIIGSISNTINQAIAGVAAKHETILIMPRATDETVLGNPFNFSLAPTERRQGRLMGRFALQQLRRDRAVILLDSYQADGDMIAKGFSEYFDKNGGQTLGSWKLKAGVSHLPTLMQEIAKMEPQLIVYPGSYRTLGPLVEEARKAGIKATWLGSDAWDHPDLLRLNTKLGAQYYFTYWDNSDPQAGVQNFVADFEAAYGHKPDVIASQGYLAIRIVLQAYAMTRSTHRDTLTKALEGGHFGQLYASGRFAKDKTFLQPAPFMMTSGNQARFMSRIDLEE